MASPGKFILLLVLSSLILSIIILSLVPPISRDALIHHLTVPKLYIEHGGIHEIPDMVFSYYPMNLDLLYMVPLYFGNDIIPKFIHFAFALLTAFFIFRYLQKRAGENYGILGSVLFLSVPIIIKLSTTVYVDLGLIFFSFASILYVIEWIESDFRWKYLIISAIFCGLGLGTKYNGLIIVFLLTLFIPLFFSRFSQNRKNSLKPILFAFIFCVISVLVASPWMIRNYYWKKNPVYPLLTGVFNPKPKILKKSGEDQKKKSGKLGIFLYRKLVYNETPMEIALLPVRLFFSGKDNNPQYFDGALHPFLLILPFFAFFNLKKDHERIRREKIIFLLFSLTLFAYTFFSTVLRARYFAPVIPPLVILSVWGTKNIADRLKNIKDINKRRIAFAGAGLLFLFFSGFTIRYIIQQFSYVKPFEYLSGKITKDEYIARHRPEYPAFMFINKNLPEDSVVLFFFIGNRGYYCRRKYIFDAEYKKGSFLTKLVRQYKDTGKILEKIKERGITHFLIRYDLFDRWVATQLKPEEQLRLKKFFNQYVENLFVKNNYGVIRLNFHGNK